MKTILTSIFALVLVLAIAGPALAQDWVLAADIPFNFNVGDSNLPSGKYTVRIFGGTGTFLVVRSSDNKKAIISLASTADTPRGLKNGKLVFNAYGDQYFLSSVYWAQGPSRMLPPSNVELQASKTEGKRKLDVASAK